MQIIIKKTKEEEGNARIMFGLLELVLQESPAMIPQITF